MKYLITICVLAIIPLAACLTLQPQTLTVNGNSADDIYVKAEAQREKGVLIHGFDTNIKGWFGCGRVDIGHEAGAIKATFENESFSCMGGKLAVNDLSNNGLLQFRMKATSETFPDDKLTFKVRFEDINGIETNYDEQTYEVKVNGNYEIVMVDFSNRLLAVNGDFDAENIFKVKIFFNSKGSSDFSGSVWIDEIRGLPSKTITLR